MAKKKTKKSVKKPVAEEVEKTPKPKKSNANKKQDNKILFAFIATFFTIIGFIIALILKKQDKYVMFYAKQGLVLFIGQIIIMALSPILLFLNPILWIFWFILWIIAWVNSLSGKQKKTFLISELAEKIKL